MKAEALLGQNSFSPQIGSAPNLVPCFIRNVYSSLNTCFVPSRCALFPSAQFTQGEPLRKQVVPLLEPSFKRGTSLFLGEGRSRPGEWGSLRRELTEWPLYQCLTSRLGENA
ncbi:hypothetical protein DEO72_LG2g4439 [Vigna unguiculata]|uniref:Uncharacterized protein n=1 Tax=Vigna unguiculata TaxID=3917 RepID=A0A4D6L6E8_VIGUN|nr:hypothetical protein DEO72_LG2g4439 [Vigna unguiculata]